MDWLLRVGPLAGNLMGARRAAKTIVQSLGAYEDLADEKGANVRTNKWMPCLTTG